MERRQFEPEELEAIAATSTGTIAMLDLARDLRRNFNSVIAKKYELNRAAAMRAACGAFLPDNGLPYRALALRLHRAV